MVWVCPYCEETISLFDWGFQGHAAALCRPPVPDPVVEVTIENPAEGEE